MISDDPSLEGAFKTPGLRGVADRAPYMHAGQYVTLEQAVRHYILAPHAAVGHSELTHREADVRGTQKSHRPPIELSDSEVTDLVRFLSTLSEKRAATVVLK